jgi:hypothetical protein
MMDRDRSLGEAHSGAWDRPAVHVGVVTKVKPTIANSINR